MLLGAHDTITIWNRYRNKQTNKDEWTRHVLSHCSWECKIESSVTDKGAVVAGAYSVLIAAHPDYRDYLTWKNLPQDERARCFTLNTGDLVALGEIAMEITGVEPYREADVLSELIPNAFQLKAFADESEPHKMGRHYLVEGV